MDVFSTELGIWLNFVKTSEFRGDGGELTPPPRYATAAGEPLTPLGHLNTCVCLAAEVSWGPILITLFWGINVPCTRTLGRLFCLSRFISIFFWLNFVNYVFLLLCFYCCVMCSFVSLSIPIGMYVPFCVFWLFVLFCVLFVCNCVLYYCHRVSTQLQLINISFFWSSWFRTSR
jgi:hypothetical protein